MERSRTPFLALPALVFAASATGQGTVVLDQAPNQVTVVYSDADCDICQGQQSIAEDFLVNTATGFHFNQLVIWGGHSISGMVFDNFAVQIYSDDQGLPDQLLFSEYGVSHTAVPTGVMVGNSIEEIEYTLTFAIPPVLQSGTYWLEVFNDTQGSGSTWGIETGTLDPYDGRDGYAYATSAPGVSWYPDNHPNPSTVTNFAMQIIGDGAQGGGPIQPYCFGNACPCGNDDPGAGCGNSTGSGALLEASGSASLAADDLAFTGSDLPAGQPALLIVGDNAPGGGNGLPFGDGLRCAGMNVLRLGTMSVDGAGFASWGPGLASGSGWSAGDVKHFQTWYRDPNGSSCGFAFNLTNGVQVTWQP